VIECCRLRRHNFADGRELATLRSALGEAQAMIISLQATASRDAAPESGGARTDQMDSQFQARLEAAVAEKTSELRAELADVAAMLEAAERKVTRLHPGLQLISVSIKLWPQIALSCHNEPKDQALVRGTAEHSE